MKIEKLNYQRNEVDILNDAYKKIAEINRGLDSPFKKKSKFYLIMLFLNSILLSNVVSKQNLTIESFCKRPEPTTATTRSNSRTRNTPNSDSHYTKLRCLSYNSKKVSKSD